MAHALDVTDAAAVDALAQELFSAGGVDLLFNNAGIGVAGRVEDLELDDWRRVVEVNLMGVVHGVHAFVPRMQALGRPAHVVNTASMAGLVAMAGLSAYSATKFAVVGMTEALDVELAGSGVRMSALCPGVINTPIVERTTARGRAAEQMPRIQRLYRTRGTSPDVVARAALDGVLARRTVIPVPRWHVMPTWTLKRLTPRVHRLLSVGLTRLLDR